LWNGVRVRLGSDAAHESIARSRGAKHSADAETIALELHCGSAGAEE